MYTLLSISKVVFIIGVSSLSIYLLNLLRIKYQQKKQEKRLAAARRAEAKRLAAQRAAREKTIADSIAQMQAAAERAAAERAAAERAAAERAAAERAAAERALSEWFAAEQAEARKEAEQKATEEQTEREQAEAKRIAAERAIAEWVAAMERDVEQTELSRPPDKRPSEKKDYKKIDAIKEQLLTMTQALEKEREELDYITHKIDAEVALLPIEVKLTFEKWKKGEAYQQSTLEDLKLKFRYKAYSIEDGWGIFYEYCKWIERQREKLLVFLRLLGITFNNSETIPQLIERAEESEWAKHLEMDMDIIFTLKEMREIFRMTVDIKSRLHALENVCKKRSRQIITPSWESHKSPKAN